MQGTFVTSAQTGTLVTNTYPVNVNDGSAIEFIGVRLDGSAGATAYVIDNGSVQFAPTSSPVSVFTTIKWGLAYKVNDFALSVNGGSPQTDVSGSLPTPNQSTIGGTIAAAGQTWVASIRYYNTRLPNATLQSLTLPVIADYYFLVDANGDQITDASGNPLYTQPLYL